MRVVRSPVRMRKLASDLKNEGKKSVLVPTMGALHEGHLALVRRARKLGDIVVVSIFVNPSQFAVGEDLERYPRNPATDKRLLKREGVDILFTPEADAIYPDDFDTYVVPGEIATRLEGAFRPTHFRGVATVVLKLFNLVQPDIAIFGCKDLQQTVVIRRMVADLNLPIRIVEIPTIRDRDGLALSSRNSYLSKQGRKRARAIPAALLAAQEKIASGERSATKIRSLIKRRLLGVVAEVDYVSVAERHTLTELKEISGEVAISLACRIDGVRLIDNIILKVN